MESVSDGAEGKIYDGYSSDDFHTLLRGELVSYYEALGTRQERLFYFEGQDPFALGLPAEAIAALYWALKPEARARMEIGLLDLLGTRAETLSGEILKQLIFAVGSIQRDDLLRPLIRTLAQRREDPSNRRPLFVATTSVVKGFRRSSTALAAARLLVGVPDYPTDLVYDMLDVLIGDRDRLWSDAVIELSGKMVSDYRPSAYRAIVARLFETAQEIAMHIPIGDVADGLNRLIAPNVDRVLQHSRSPMRDPVGILIASLVLDNGAPFQVRFNAFGATELAATGSYERTLLRAHDALHRLLDPVEEEPLAWLQRKAA